ncbi:MAG: hypothetical protein ACJ74U_09415 [Jatrophihabitantaceae bacterium]
MLAVCVVGMLAGAGWLMLRPQPAPSLVSYGRPISNAGALLSQTEASMRRQVHLRHGALVRSSRCYYTSQSADDAGNAGSRTVPAGNQLPGRTVIGDRMLCGPVLFVDGDASRPYLTYNLIASPTGHGQLRLSVSSPDGEGLGPDPRPDSRLVRPDGQQPPSRVSISWPPPPPAVGDVLTTTGTLRTPITPAPDSAAMIGQLSGVRLVEYGFVNVYGWGDRARTAPAGYRLLAFAAEPVPGELAAANPDLSVRVDGRERGPLAVTSDYVVIAVPKHARQVDLVLTDSGMKQSVSLLTGKPSVENPAVTVRSHDRQQLNVVHQIRVRLTTSAGTGVLSGTLLVRQVSLSYWAADGDCPRPDQAWLHVGVLLRLEGDTQPYGAEPGLISVALPGGGKLVSVNAASDPASGVDDVVEVPASLTAGSLTFAGTVHTAKGTLTVLTPVTVPFEIPAG